MMNEYHGFKFETSRIVDGKINFYKTKIKTSSDRKIWFRSRKKIEWKGSFYLRVLIMRVPMVEGKPDPLALLKTKLIEDDRTSSLFASTLPSRAGFCDGASPNFAIGDFGLIPRRGELIIEITRECRRFFFFGSCFYFVIIFL